jgi:TRAP transporter TAXI family solute receptor
LSDQSDRQYQAWAAAAGILALIAAFSLRRVPRWLRIVVVALVVGAACGAGVYAYRSSVEPQTLSVAGGSLDGDVPKLLGAIASRLAAANAPVRLKVIEKPDAASAAAAFAKGEADLAVVRADAGDLSSARAVMIVARAVALLLAPTGTGVKDIDDLKGKTIGVIGEGINGSVIAALSRQYDLERAKTRFRDVAPAGVAQAFQMKQVQALLLVLPISEKYISRVRDLAVRNPKLKMTLLPIDAAEAIAAINPAYESFELPKGTIRGSPPVPDDDLTTLRVPFYLVARKTLSDEAAGALAKAVFETRRDLATDYPLLTQIMAPSTDKDTFLPAHPGAAAYFSGDQKSFFDRYGDQLFYGSMMLGMLMSLLAGVWKFMVQKPKPDTAEPPLGRLFAVMDDVRAAQSAADLAKAEDRIDDVLRQRLGRYEKDDVEPDDCTALSLVTHRLERLLERRRLELGAAPSGPGH